MPARTRRFGSVANELVKKAREAMLTAVQIYNNPQVDFKSELFIVTTIIAWTYLLHAHYRKIGVEYRQLNFKGKKPKFLKTKHGADWHLSLEQCLGHSKSPVDDRVRTNLMFLVGIRHEIEHQMTTRIDDQLSAKFMAAALNFNSTIKALFGRKFALDSEQAFSIQFSSISESTAKTLLEHADLPCHIRSFVTQFESAMTQEDFDDPRYSYRVAFVKKTTQSKTAADQVIQFVAAGSETEAGVNEVFLKETEKRKYKPGTIVALMKQEGFRWFNMHLHTLLWKHNDGRNPSKGHGITVEGEWYWYENWIPVVRDHCQTQTNLREPLLAREPTSVRLPAHREDTGAKVA